MTNTELQQEIRKLKKLKLQCRAGTDERIALYRQIKDLKKQLTQVYVDNNDKDKIIAEILKFKPSYITAIRVIADYYKFSIEDLQKHLNKLKQRNGGTNGA
jgi:cell shape-determining protein MreC